jgi:hypothetical protein
VEQIGRSIDWSFEFFPQTVFSPTVQAKTGLTGFPNRFHHFSPVGCCEEFLSKKVSVVLWLFLFRGGEVPEVGFLFEGFFEEFLDKIGLTGLLNWSDRFLRTMCGWRTGGWSLPCVMSD